MTWRLDSIVLYQRDGPGREKLPFKPSGLNIISGNSQTGKSAVIDIINYCLMSEACPIPKGVIRRAVSHVGIHLVSGDRELQVLRPLPKPGAKSSTQAWWQAGTNLSFPNDIPEMKWDRVQVRDILSDFTGISGAEVVRNARDPTQPNHSATIRQATPLLFQPQDVIANRYVSFPGLDSIERRRAVLDALPYLLKIESAEFLEKRAELRRLNAELRLKNVQSAERLALRANAYPRGMRLWLECKGRGLVDGEPPSDIATLFQSLSLIQLAEEQRFELATTVPDIERLERDEQLARSKVARVRRQIRELNQFEESTKLHDQVVSGQIRRLSIAELLPEGSGGAACPICREGQLRTGPGGESVERLLAGLVEFKAVPLRIDEGARKARLALERDRVALEEAHAAAKAALREAVAQVSRESPQLVEARELDVLRGKVQEYLESVNSIDFVDEEDDLDDLKRRIEELKRELDSRQGLRERYEAEVADDMTRLAKEMEVEFQDGRAALDLKGLTISVQVDRDEDALTTLSEVGSGANWVSYHVAAAVALHRHFVRQKCKVPRLLVLDQPSQAWFPKITKPTPSEPQDPAQERPPPPEKPEDLQRVENVYKLLVREAEQEGAPQIIVLDHAYFDEHWFTSRVIREWRAGLKLVPPHWDPEHAMSTTAGSQ